MKKKPLIILLGGSSGVGTSTTAIELSKMDKIQFITKKEQEDNRKWIVVTIMINGKSIIEMLKVYEKPFAEDEGHPNLAGGYDWMEINTFLSYIVGDYITNYGKISILTCPCGCDGCWPMQIRVVENKENIHNNEYQFLI